MRRFASFVALLAISIVGYTLLTNVSASAATLGWTGAGGSNHLYEANNWEPAQIPATDDILIFQGNTNGPIDTTHGPNTPVFNTVEVMEGANITFTSSNGAELISRIFLIERDAKVTIDKIHITGSSIQNNVGFLAVGEGGELNVGGQFLQSALELIIGVSGGNGPGVVKINGYYPSTNEQMVTVDAGVTLEYRHAGGDSSPRFMTVKSGSILDTNHPNILGTSETILEESAHLVLSKGFSTDRNLAIGNNSKIWGIDSNSSSSNITLSGQVKVLNQGNDHSSAKVIYDAARNKINLLLTGNLIGGKIVPLEGTMGSVIVSPAAGKSNTSATPNGETKPAIKTTVITDSNSSSLTVFGNNIIVINGQRGNVTVQDAGILKGKGTVGVLTVLSGGRVAPGESPGILNAGNTTFNSGSFFEAEIAGTEVGSGYDQLKVTGAINLGDSNLDVKLLNGFKPQVDNKFIIVDNDGTDAITGTFKDLSEGASLVIDGVTFRISYVGGDGNDVELLVASVSNAPSVPGTPNTGFGILLANPLVTLLGTVASAGTLFVMARKYSLFSN